MAVLFLCSVRLSGQKQVPGFYGQLLETLKFSCFPANSISGIASYNDKMLNYIEKEAGKTGLKIIVKKQERWYF